MGLTNDIALMEIQKLYDMCFDTNAKCDRMVYLLSLPYNMIDFSKWFHENIAHTFPVWADTIQGYGYMRGDLFYRGAIGEHRENYTDVVSMMEDLAITVRDIEKQCVKALKVCAENESEGFEDFLRDFNIKHITPMLKQITVFYNQIKAYSDNRDLHKWNRDFESWLIPEFREAK